MEGLLDHVGAIIAGIFDNPIVRLLGWGFVAYITMVWLASAYWVLQDMRRRHPDPMLPFIAAGGIIIASPVLFPAAVFVYRIVRPGETLAEARERELTERLDELDDELRLACPGCAKAVEDDWLICPECRSRLAHRCANCGRTMGLDWTLCGWCGEEFGRPVLPDRLPGA
ncbi:MAG TPA: zinc ribbon domain-containing protein, partial [Vitreimonas sp.]|nr:zinc ribbon domain-containing protein [Vitreimonas sp.]